MCCYLYVRFELGSNSNLEIYPAELSFTMQYSSRTLSTDKDDEPTNSGEFSGDRPSIVLTDDATLAISIACSILGVVLGVCLFYLIRKLKERRGAYFSRELAYSQSSWVPVILTINVDEVLAIELSETGVANCTDVTNGKEKKYIVDPRLLRYSQPLSQSGPLSPSRRGKTHSRVAVLAHDSFMSAPLSSESKATGKELKEDDVFDKTYSNRRKMEGLPFDNNNIGDPNILSRDSALYRGQGREDSDGGGDAEGIFQSIASSSLSSRASFETDPGTTSSTSSGSSLSSSAVSSASESPRKLSMVCFSEGSLSEPPLNNSAMSGVNANNRRARRLQLDDVSTRSETMVTPSVYESKQARSSGVLKTVLQEVRYVPVVSVSSGNQDIALESSSEKKRFRRGSVITA